MTTPYLAALRTLVDAVERWRSITAALDAHIGACDDCRIGWASAQPCGVVEMYAQLRSAVTAIAIALPAAQEAMERMGKPVTGTNSAHAHGNCELCDYQEARLARLEEALLKYGQHGPRCPIWATQARGSCTCGLDAAMEGRDE